MRYFAFEAFDPDTAQTIWAQQTLDDYVMRIGPEHRTAEYNAMVTRTRGQFQRLAPRYTDFKLIMVYEIDFTTGERIEIPLNEAL